MKSLPLLILLLFYTVPVGACDSYESCMELARKGPLGKEHGNVWSPEYPKTYYIAAIAYKLADIEKELKHRD